MAGKFAAARGAFTNRKLLRYGIIGTVGAAAGAVAGSLRSNDYEFQRESDAKSSALIGASAGATLTGAVLKRKGIGKIASAAFHGAKEGSKVFFRRVRGRIVPIRVKAP